MCRTCKLQHVQSASHSQQVGKIVQKVISIDSKRSESVFKIKRVLKCGYYLHKSSDGCIIYLNSCSQLNRNIAVTGRIWLLLKRVLLTVQHPPPHTRTTLNQNSFLKLWQSFRQTNRFYTNSFHHRSTRRLNGPLIL